MRKSTMRKTGSTLQKSKLGPKPQERSVGNTNQLKKSSTINRSKTKLITHAKEGSTRRIGDKAEAQMKHEVCPSISIEDTRNSGALHYDGDFLLHLSQVVGDYVRCEGKFRKTSGFTISKKHWSEIKEKSMKHGGIPAIVTQNVDGEVLITMSLKQFSHTVRRDV